MMNNETPLIITGMHRSGTSLVAGFIHRSGIDLGSELVGAKKSNPFGHFEDMDILEFQRSVLLREFGHQMWVPQPPRLGEADKARAMELVSARQNKPYWGWKEPRTSLFLDFWDELLPDARYLFIVRHPLLVLDSLSRRNNTRVYHFWKHNTFLRAWLVYNQECLRFYQAQRARCTLVTLERVLQAPDAFVDLLSQRLTFEFDVQVFRALYDSTALTDKKSQRLPVSPRLYSKSLALYDQIARSDNLSRS